MSMIFFTYRARTQARMGVEVLREAGIPVKLDRTPSNLSQNGCGYGLWVPSGRGKEAAELLRQQERSYMRSYHMENGAAREVRL